MKTFMYEGSLPFQISAFPKDCERSCEGSIYLYPSTTVEMTDGEFEHFSKRCPAVAKKLRELKSAKRKVRPKPVKAEPVKTEPVEVKEQISEEKDLRQRRSK